MQRAPPVLRIGTRVQLPVVQVMAQLQGRIMSMQSQLLIGGQKMEDLPQFR
jgi:hypothetical protein